jgi:hypothetical protein
MSNFEVDIGEELKNYQEPPQTPLEYGEIKRGDVKGPLINPLKDEDKPVRVVAKQFLDKLALDQATSDRNRPQASV